MIDAERGIDTRALGDTIGSLLLAPARVAAGLAEALLARGSGGIGCGCEIPPPCWEPRRAGTCGLVLTPGATGTVHVHVDNCDWVQHLVGITALGQMAGWLTFNPTTLVVGPQSRATFVVTVNVPKNVKQGQTFSGPLLVRGCVDHAVRLEVAVSACADRTHCVAVVRDCQDHIHHWYDHFYCPRPCRNVVVGGRTLSNG